MQSYPVESRQDLAIDKFGLYFILIYSNYIYVKSERTLKGLGSIPAASTTSFQNKALAALITRWYTKVIHFEPATLPARGTTPAFMLTSYSHGRCAASSAAGS